MLIVLVCLGKTIDLTGDNTIIKSTNFNVDKDGNIIATSGTLGGWSLSNAGLVDETGNIYLRSNGYSSIYTYADFIILKNYLLGKITLTDVDISDHYDINGDGIIDTADTLLLRRKILGLD